MKIRGHTAMKKDELIKAIIKHEEGGAPEKSKSKSKSKSPSRKSKEVAEPEMVEELVEAPPKSKSKSGGKSRSKSGGKSRSESAEKCGKYSYNELLDKRITELRKILAKQGVDASSVENPQQAAELSCQLSQHGTCDENFGCADGNVCDISTKPGVCVDAGSASRHDLGKVGWLDYNGQQIIGDRNAIKSLRKKLKVPKYRPPDPKTPEGIAKFKLMKKIMQVTGDTEENLNRLSEGQLRAYLEGYEVAEKRERARVIDMLAKEDQSRKSYLTDLSTEELYRRAYLVKEHLEAQPEDAEDNRQEMVEQLASLFNRDPSEYDDWETYEIKERLSAAREWEQPKAQESESSEEEEAPAKKPAKKKPVSESSEEEEEAPAEKPASESSEEEKEEAPAEKPASESSEEEKEEAPRRRKQEDVDIKDVTKVLSDVMSGKKGEIEDFSHVQNTVLKCLGLVSA